jgi:hypothetical protein
MSRNRILAAAVCCVAVAALAVPVFGVQAPRPSSADDEDRATSFQVVQEDFGHGVGTEDVVDAHMSSTLAADKQIRVNLYKANGSSWDRVGGCLVSRVSQAEEIWFAKGVPVYEFGTLPSQGLELKAVFLAFDDEGTQQYSYERTLTLYP